MDKCIKFVMLYYDDYLNAMLGKYGNEITDQLWSLRDELRRKMPEWRQNPKEKAEIDSRVFMRYLELMNINLNIDDN